MKDAYRHLRQIELKSDTTLTAARRGDYDLLCSDVSCSDKGLWVYSNDPYRAPMAVICADSWHEAWREVEDIMPTVAPEDEHEAYGFDTAEEFKAACDAAHAWEHFDSDIPADWPELVEGYSYQSNCTGTGIVEHGHYANLSPLTRYHLRTARISLTVEAQ